MADSDRFLGAGAQSYVFQLVEDVHDSSLGASAIAVVFDEEGRTAKVRVNLPEGSDIGCWDSFAATCSIRAPSEQAASYYWSRGCVGSVSPWRVAPIPPSGVLGALSAFRSSGLDAFPAQWGEGAIFMRSIAFGQRRELFDSPFYGQVKRVGLAHMVAVSGAHLSITIGALSLLLRRLRVPRAPSVIVQMAACIAFVLTTGAPYSALRACTMTCCMLLSFVAGRRALSLNALSVCVIAFHVLWPHIALSVSFLLSALSTCGIILFAGYFASWFSALAGGRYSVICDLLGMTLSALLFTLPASASLFSQVSLIAPFANLVAAPIFAALCVGGMIAGIVSSIFPQATFLAVLVCRAAQAFCEGVSLLARVPYAALSVSASPVLVGGFVVALVVLLVRRWPKATRIGAVAALGGITVSTAVALFVLPLAHGCEIVMLDVGQGDAFVLRSGGRAILVDTGNQDSLVLFGLARHDVRHLDAVLVTHPDDDHCGSLGSVLDFAEVDRILVAADLLSCPCANCSTLRQVVDGRDVVGLHAGDVVSWGAFSAEVLSPESFTCGGGNDDSLVMFVDADVDADGTCDATAFLCGDAESEVLSRLNAQGILRHADILKVGHHGSSGAFTAEQLEVLSPTLALVSVGENNRYGHPAPDTVALLDEYGVSIARTDTDGDVVCRLSPEGMAAMRFG